MSSNQTLVRFFYIHTVIISERFLIFLSIGELVKLYLANYETTFTI